MNIILIGNKTLHKLKLPLNVEGSYFLNDSVTNDVLLNFEARENAWLMRSSEEVNVKDINGNLLELITIKPNDLFLLEYKNQQRVVFCAPLYDDTTQIYNFEGDISLKVGRDENNEIVFNNPFIEAMHLEIKYIGGKWFIGAIENSFVYVNGLLLNGNKQLNNGDLIYLYGLQIYLLKGLIIINNPYNSVSIKPGILNTYQLSLVDVEKNEEIDLSEVIEEDLYKDNEYFFKTPRLRRFVETFDLSVANPPAKQDTEEMPMLLTVGPMLTMALMSAITAINVLTRIKSGQTTFKNSWTSLLTPCIMLLTSILWPSITKAWQKRNKKRKERKRQKKYREYLEEKKKVIESEAINQTAILKENLISLDDCVKIIMSKDRTLWERKLSQKDFLTVRVGIGDHPIDMDVKYNDDEFQIDKDDLKDEASAMVDSAKMLHQVPIGYSFFDKKATAILGNAKMARTFVNNAILQLVTFHSYDELKIAILTDEEHKSEWEMFKDLPHLFSNDREIRLFATTEEERDVVSDYLENELIKRAVDENTQAVENEAEKATYSPYYLIFTDDYLKIRKLGICERVFDIDADMGFGFAILENRLSHLPSKCIDFITVDNSFCGILRNDVDDYTQVAFQSELNDNIDIKSCVDILANIPIEFEESMSYLPTSLSFLEMYNVGKVEQLNIMNRWKMNDPTQSLRAPIGVNDQGNIIVLDLHEKYHGPHGLIAGTTGSGKSEFIITYILSMAINYSPNEVAFILIDYKGGGLAGAFENKKNNIRLPHLAGTITNLDKNELNRTLVSIQSELTRRQSVFNDARDQLGESTIDIYKYQKFFREGKLNEPMPHLFIICDEFAELKQQQPEFMDNLISAARIGRSLGVHLILATQKPSGVVNDQIWSNTKFRVCLKVAEKSDSNEVIKKPDAAEIKNAGRFYLQVGYDDIFVLGQSGYAGMPYSPSDIVKKEYDRSLSIINNIGAVIKNISGEPAKKKIVSDGDELSNTLAYITLLAKKENVQARNLWLDNISPDLTLVDVINKYEPNYSVPTAIIGEYDDPANQRQDILTLPLDTEGNTMIYGISSSNRERFIRTLIYSVVKRYSSDDINFYIFDFGSESFSIFQKLPHVGDVVLSSETEKIDKLLKLINEEILTRKKLFADYNGEFENYNRNSGNKLPIMTVIINNLESFKELYSGYDELLLKLTREGKRVGVIFIMATTSQSGLFSRFLKNFNNTFVLDMNSKDEYQDILGRIGSAYPADVDGRGLFKGESVYEFQVASICDEDTMVEFIKQEAETLKESNPNPAKSVPVLPEVVTLDMLKDSLKSISEVPVGIAKLSLKNHLYDFKADKATIIGSNELSNTKSFIANLLTEFKALGNIVTVLFDTEGVFSDCASLSGSYCNENYDNFIDQIITFVDEKIANTAYNMLFIIAGIEKFKSVVDSKKLDLLMDKIKKTANVNALFVDTSFKLKKLVFEPWYVDLVVNTNGIWIGSGAAEQTAIKASDYNKKYQERISNNFAWAFKNGDGILIKLVGGEEESEE